MLVKSLVERLPTSADPAATILSISRMMRDDNSGAVLILQGDHLIGIVTDRDIATKFSLFDKNALSRPVSDIMSRNPLTCRDTSKVTDAAIIMADNQVRRLPVTDKNGHIVGLITVDNIAESCSEHLAGETLGEIVEERRKRSGDPVGFH